LFFLYLETQLNQVADDIYELLGRSINQLVKYFDDTEKKRGLITPILCGEDGLVNALEKTLSYGLKKTTGNVPFFGGGRKRYVWDFLSKQFVFHFSIYLNFLYSKSM
jgi:hypothetical protein